MYVVCKNETFRTVLNLKCNIRDMERLKRYVMAMRNEKSHLKGTDYAETTVYQTGRHGTRRTLSFERFVLRRQTE